MSKAKRKRRLEKPQRKSLPSVSPRRQWDSEHIDVVIPVHDQLALLRRTVETVKATSGERLGRIIFVDDASTETGLGQFCTAEGRYLRNFQNVGFARTSNRGASMVETSRFVLLNSDMEAQPGWLDALVEVMERIESCTIVAPLLLFSQDSTDPARPAGKVQSCGFAFNVEGVPYHRLIAWSPENPKVQQERADLQGATAACWLIERKVWQQLRGFEESFGSYFEDIDFCVRAKTAGYTIAYTPKAVLHHKVGASWQGQNNQLALKAQFFMQRQQGKYVYDEHLLL